MFNEVVDSDFFVQKDEQSGKTKIMFQFTNSTFRVKCSVFYNNYIHKDLLSSYNLWLRSLDPFLYSKLLYKMGQDFLDI